MVMAIFNLANLVLESRLVSYVKSIQVVGKQKLEQALTFGVAAFPFGFMSVRVTSDGRFSCCVHPPAMRVPSLVVRHKDDR